MLSTWLVFFYLVGNALLSNFELLVLESPMTIGSGLTKYHTLAGRGRDR